MNSSESKGCPLPLEMTKALENALKRQGLDYEVNPGDGAFYGPKIDVEVTDAIGRKWQCATIQLDYQLPQRFDLKYTGADNAEHRPVVIHRAIFGSFERFMALLIEHYAGAFPPWLAPVQVQGIPIAERHNDYLAGVAKQMRAQGLRVEVDDSDDRMQKKIRNAQLQKVPFMVIAGDRDMEEGAVSFRYRNGDQDNGVPVDEAVQRVAEAVAKRIQV